MEIESRIDFAIVSQSTVDIILIFPVNITFPDFSGLSISWIFFVVFWKFSNASHVCFFFFFNCRWAVRPADGNEEFCWVETRSLRNLDEFHNFAKKNYTLNYYGKYSLFMKSHGKYRGIYGNEKLDFILRLLNKFGTNFCTEMHRSLFCDLLSFG